MIDILKNVLSNYPYIGETLDPIGTDGIKRLIIRFKINNYLSESDIIALINALSELWLSESQAEQILEDLNEKLRMSSPAKEAIKKKNLSKGLKFDM